VLFRDNLIARRLAGWMRPDQSLLDVGSGNGELAAAVTRLSGVKPTLCDVRRFGKVDMPFLVQADPLSIPAESQSFDVVTLCFVLHHIADPKSQETLLHDALRVARERVILLEDTPVGSFERAANVAWDWVLNAPRGVPTPFTFRSAEAWRTVLSTSGFKVTEVETFRGAWPTLWMYRHSLLVADRSPAARTNTSRSIGTAPDLT
jgi:ubiquinone/menaquinone biosynthesis C-methylase UbiE